MLLLKLWFVCEWIEAVFKCLNLGVFLVYVVCVMVGVDPLVVVFVVLFLSLRIIIFLTVHIYKIKQPKINNL